MLSDKYTRLLRTIIITGLAFVVNYGINLILTPFITSTVGTEAYGFVSLAKNIAQYATIITSALNSFASRYIAVEYHQNNKQKANTFFSSVFYGDLALGTTIFAIAIVGILFLDRILNIPVEIVTDIKILFLFVFVNFWITTAFTAFNSAAYIANKLDITGAFKGLSYVTEAVVLVICYSVFPAYVFYVGFGLIVASLVIALSNIFICKKYTPELTLKPKYFSMDSVKKLVVAGIWSSFNSLGNLLNSGLDLLVCNLMLTSLAMGQLAIAKTIETIFAGLLQLVAQAFQPIFLKSYASNDRTKLLSELKLSMKFSGMLSNLAFAGFFAFGLVYCKLWIPDQDITLVYQLTMITVLASVASGPMTPLYYIYTLTVKLKVPCIVTITGGLFNMVGMYFLIKYSSLGIYAVVWTTAIVMTIINFVTNPLYMAHILRMPLKTFYPGIIRNVISCVALCIVFKAFSLIYMPSSWLTLIFVVIICAVIGGLIHLLIVCNKSDWKSFRAVIRGI